MAVRAGIGRRFSAVLRLPGSLPRRDSDLLRGNAHQREQREGRRVDERFFTPRLRFKTYEEMNAWLLDKCIVAFSGRPNIAARTGRVRGHLAQRKAGVARHKGEFLDYYSCSF
jgi:hypothetical protein